MKTEIKKLFETTQIGVPKGFLPKVDAEGKVAFLGMIDIDEKFGRFSNINRIKKEEIKSGFTKFSENAVLLAKITPCTQNNKTAIVTEPNGGYATTEVYPIHAGKNLEPFYLMHFLRSPSVRAILISSMTGATGRQRVPVNIVRNLEIPVPPLQEQKRIIKKLDAIFERIDKAIRLCEENIQHTEALMASVLSETFSANWESKPLSEISSIISGYAFKSTDFSDNGAVRSIKITNVGVGEFVETDGDYLPKSFSIVYSNFTANEDDVAVALTRSFINDGLKVCRVPKEYNGSLVNQRVAVLKPIKGVCNIDFIYHFLRSPFALDYVMEKSKSLNQPNLSIKDLGALLIPTPDLETQKQIAEKISKLHVVNSALLSELNSKLNHLKALKSSLLDQAFKGVL